MPLIRFMLASIALFLAIGLATDEAISSNACTSLSASVRTPAVGGRVIRVVYAFGRDAPDRSDQWREAISSDVGAITAWWRTQDTEREPRFRLASASCGTEPQVETLQLPDSQATLAPLAGRAERITRAVLIASDGSPFEKSLVYYDGPVAAGEARMCGQGGGEADGAATAIVFLAACPAVESEVVGAHELLHALGGAPRQGPPNRCAGSELHVCDSSFDLLSPIASHAGLDALRLDVGGDDYYGHEGNWPDLQDSRWLRLVNGQVPLTLEVQGAGRVRSNVPGVDCSSACVSEWDIGTVVSLEAAPARGSRFVGWTGECSRRLRCDLVLGQEVNVRAVFALKALAKR